MTGFTKPEEFDAWKLSWELKERVVALTATNPAACDFKFCEEILKSARSAPDNFAEGFYRFNPTDFANFVRIARGSLVELRNQLRHAHSSKYLTDEDFQDVHRLCRRAIGACTGLRLYLLSLPKDFDPRRHSGNPNRQRRSKPGRVEPEPQEPEPGTGIGTGTGT